MEPHELGKKYDKIAVWWQEQLRQSTYGVAQLERAIQLCEHKTIALDVGCGSGGRMLHKLQEHGYVVQGVDVSAEMLKLARNAHPEATFHHADISTWTTDKSYDLILAWDSIFHLPLHLQAPVVTKLCALLNHKGILLYTFGNDYGYHESNWQNDTFPYSSIGINQNLQLLMANGCEPLHLELDQYPEKHVYVIAKKIAEL